MIACSMTTIRRALGVVLIAVAPARAQSLPDHLTDQQFWKLVTDMSEPGGYEWSNNVVSNEGQAQRPIASLERTIAPGTVFVGVGLEQNFTYIAALRPKLAFIVDARRQTLVEHLLYKVLFETSSDRADFMSKLFCRPRPAGLDSTSTAAALVAAYRTAARDTALARRTRGAVLQNLEIRGFVLSNADISQLEYISGAFCEMGVDLDFDYQRSEGRRLPTYGELMTSIDSSGIPRSFLATEANWRTVRSLEQRNLVVPVVGDLAGDKALRAAGQYVRDHGAVVGAFYASIVEISLFRQYDDWRRYYDNVAALPIDSTSTFIRSIGGGFRTGYISFPILQWETAVCSMQQLLSAYADGRIQNYGDVMRMSR